jgi:hypothetical protein
MPVLNEYQIRAILWMCRKIEHNNDIPQDMYEDATKLADELKVVYPELHREVFQMWATPFSADEFAEQS